MLPTTVDRVSQHTDPDTNYSIRQETLRSIAYCAASGQSAIAERLQELDAEWDIERCLEANASSIVLLGVGIGSIVDRRFFALPAIVAGFLLQHALQGWCPPVGLFRRLGFRTAREIDIERNALKALRGDYQGVFELPLGENRVDLDHLMSVVER